MAMAGYVYRAYGADGALLYIGTSRNWGRRWAQHSHTATFFALVRRLEIACYDTETLAHQAEFDAIRTEQPPFNRRGIGVERPRPDPRFSSAGLRCPTCGCRYDLESGALFGSVLGGPCGDRPDGGPPCPGRLVLDR